jgi:hypothetical protein
MRRAGLAAAAALVVVTACTGKPPEIGLIDLKPIYVRNPATGAVDARMRLYLQASDPDGVEDLAAFYLIHDGKEIFWEVRGGAWHSGGEGWIGTHSLALPSGWQVPGGTYRVVLEDAAGETVERQVRVDPVAPAGLRFPRAVDTGSVTVEPANAWVWAYSDAGDLVTAAPPAQVPWDRVGTYFVYAADARLRVGLLSGPYTR